MSSSMIGFLTLDLKILRRIPYESDYVSVTDADGVKFYMQLSDEQESVQQVAVVMKQSNLTIHCFYLWALCGNALLL